ncbi:hypothetical protein AAFF_G00051660 [Aldrovandia affinis]|uniref:Uncharacterized protein n=1 Tax=Aldrovandia affinis TaxID=143900 RepID=A0AAD7WYF1_9TELE|nr:hypothetical protein AAFF_G00051660 [Aldrovandia affinis]
MDSISVLQSPSQSHSGDLLVFQTEPYSLHRLCEDCIGRNAWTLRHQLSWLPTKFQETVKKRISFFRTAAKSQGIHNPT